MQKIQTNEGSDYPREGISGLPRQSMRDVYDSGQYMLSLPGSDAT